MIGLEPTFEEHQANLVEVFREVRRVLRKDGTCWLNYGDAYASGNGMTGRNDTDRETPGGRGGSFRGGERETKPKSGLKPKDLMMMPARVALALQADGWWIRSEIIWHKPNPMPESCKDRPTSAHEKLYLLSKSAKYFYDAEAVRVAVTGTAHARRKDGMPSPGEGSDLLDNRDSLRRHRSIKEQAALGANLRNVWTIPTHGFSAAHFATFPPKLVEPCIKAGTSERGVCKQCGGPWVREVKMTDEYRDFKARANGQGGVGNEGVDSNRQGKGHHPHTVPTKNLTTGWSPTCQCTPQTYVPATVLDPFAGSGTVALVAQRMNRDAILIEISEEYAEMARKRIERDSPMFAEVEKA